MESRRPPEYTLEVFANPEHVKDVVKAILHTIFFHRSFGPILPATQDILDLTLPAIDDVDLETLIDQRATSLVRAIENPTTAGTGAVSGNSNNSNISNNININVNINSNSNNNGSSKGGSNNNGQSGRGQIAVSFYEKKRRKSYFFGKGEDEVCWEMWTLDVTCASPRTETEAMKVRRAMEKSLHKTAWKIVNIVNRDKDHIPPITTTETNPFPHQIIVNPKSDGWGPRMGIF